MSSFIKESELITNPDGSIYHLALLPGDIAMDIITVGDPQRVDMIAQYFDDIRVDKQNREFKTVTGTYQKKELTIIATGIGTDNIDIVLNELDALVNIDFATRSVKSNFTQLSFYRIGTSGSIQSDIAVDQLLMSQYAIGLDTLAYYYSHTETSEPSQLAHIELLKKKPHYLTSADQSLLQLFSNHFKAGTTITAPGFYAPQGRTLRVHSTLSNTIEALSEYEVQGIRLTNLEMETAGIYLLSKHLGHRAISLNAILANRPNGTFSNQASKTIQKLIKKTLSIIVNEE